MKQKLLFNCVAMLTFAAIFYQCTDPFDRYEDPPWLGGTNIVTLEKEGNYTQFLALMDRAEYRTSIENQLFTLFVPNDSSFQEYYKKRGINSVDDLSVQEAEELFGQHILVNPRSREQLLYEYSGSWGELESPTGEYKSLFHRKKTYSIPLDYTEEVRYNETFKGETLKLYRQNTFIPLFTTEYFEDYFGDPNGSDYLFMYPGSKWSGTQWNDAMVTEAQVPTSSGFIYYIDRVVAPIPTIDKYLKDHQDEFGLFWDLAQRFANYASPIIDENKERTYRKSYPTLSSNIADERGPSTGDPGNMVSMFTSFVPYDDVLQEFLDNTVFKYYESIDSVPQLFLVYLLQSHLVNFLNLPSKMEKRFFNFYGDQIDIDVHSDIATSIMCSNGVIYAMNKVLEPNAFSCVPGPIFYNSNYTAMLYALTLSGDITSLTQDDLNVTLFAANNDKLLDYGIRYKNNEGDVSMEIRASDGVWKTLTVTDLEGYDLEEFVQDHIYLGTINDFSGEGYLRMVSDNYIHYKDGKIYGGGNQVTGDYAQVVEKIESEKNGNLFYIDKALQNNITAAQFILSDPDLSSFAQLLTTAGMIDSVQYLYEQPGVKYPRLRFIPQQNQWTVLAPTNQAIADAEGTGLIPTDEDKLEKFIHYHFVRGTCVFDDGKFSGEVTTQKVDTVIGTDNVYAKINFTNSVNNLSVTDGSGKTVNISHADADNLIKRGVVHKINSVLVAEP